MLFCFIRTTFVRQTVQMDGVYMLWKSALKSTEMNETFHLLFWKCYFV